MRSTPARALPLSGAMNATLVDALATLLDPIDDAPTRASRLIHRIGGAGRLAVSPAGRLGATGLVSPTEASRIAAAFRFVLAALDTEPEAPVVSPERVARSVPALCTRPTEELWVVSVDVGLRPLSRDLVARAGPSVCAATPADVLRPPLLAGASGMFVLHNHPSGDPTPSEADKRFTARVSELAALAQLTLHDHVVVAGGRWASCVSDRRGRARPGVATRRS